MWSYRRATRCSAMRSQFPQWSSKLGDDHMLDLSVLGHISDTALTSETEIQMTAAGLPNTFVPGRNLLFFQLAAAVGYRRGLHTLVGGMCETDFSGYPTAVTTPSRPCRWRCRWAWASASPSRPPLMWLDKAQTGTRLAPGRRRAGGHRAGAIPHLLPRGARRAPRLGLRLRHLPCMRLRKGGI